MKKFIRDKEPFSRLRLLTLFSLLGVIILGFWCKYYRGWGQEWLNNYVAAIWYEVFWCLLIFGCVPKRAAIRSITLWVFSLTCALEFLQLWHPPFLEWIRSVSIGRLLLGTSFSEWDFLYYGAGCLLGWWWLEQIWQFHQFKEK